MVSYLVHNDCLIIEIVRFAPVNKKHEVERLLLTYNSLPVSLENCQTGITVKPDFQAPLRKD